MLLNNQWVNEEIRKYIEVNESRNTTFQNLWDTAKAVLRGKFIVIQAFLKKQGKPQINYLIFHLKALEKEEQTKPEVSRNLEITKIEQIGRASCRERV